MSNNSMQLGLDEINCRNCNHKWLGYISPFDRGHSILVKDNRVVLIADDLGYNFPEHCPPKDIKNVSHFSDPLKSMGWSDIRLCPECASGDIEAQYDSTKQKTVKYIELDEKDFEFINSRWQLTEVGLRKARN